MLPTLPNWRCCSRECWILTFVVLAYFVIFPADLQVILSPMGPIVETLKNVLSMSYSISGWLYIMASVAILAWAVVRIWGPRTTPAP